VSLATAVTRRSLKFGSPDDVAADVKRLRPGCSHSGNWNLAQTCWHLDKALRSSMRPGPYDPAPPSLVQKMQLKAILALGRIPGGVQAPERVVPSPDVPETAVDDMLEALEMLKQHTGPFAPHRMLGEIEAEKFLRLHLIHCAHHLSLLSPMSSQG
jgi:hypothetical protein